MRGRDAQLRMTIASPRPMIFDRRPECLDRAVLVDQYRLYLGHSDWALSIALNEDHNLLVSAEGVGAVGCEFRDINNLDRLLACAQGMLNRLVEANERTARE